MRGAVLLLFRIAVTVIYRFSACIVTHRRPATGIRIQVVSVRASIHIVIYQDIIYIMFFII